MHHQTPVRAWLEKVRVHKKSLVPLISVGVILVVVLELCIGHNYRKAPDTVVSKSVRWTWGCVYETDVPLLQKYSQLTKSKSYNTVMTPDENAAFVKRCLITKWHAIHFVGHIMVAFFLPLFPIEIILASTAYEIYEYFRCKCHDVSDIVYNVAGVMCGVYLRRSADALMRSS